MTTRLWAGVMATMAAANAAVAKSLGEMAEDAERDLKIMTGFFEVAFYMLGILVFVFGLFRVKKHMDQPQQVSLWSAGVAMVVGAAIIAVPPIINGIGETFGITGGRGLSPP